jgi:hypothetical protein
MPFSPELLTAIGRLAETLQQNPAGAAAVVALAFFALVAWVVHMFGK